MNERRSDQELFLSSEVRGYVGGGYFNPVSDFMNIARPLESSTIAKMCDVSCAGVESHSNKSYFISDLYSEIQSLLRPDEVLFALYDTGRYQLAAHIIDAERLMEFELRVSRWELDRVGFFGVQRMAAQVGLSNKFTPSW